VHLGINVKKSISGLKSYLKTLNKLSDYFEKRKGGEIIELDISNSNNNSNNNNSSKRKVNRNYQFLDKKVNEYIQESKSTINTCSLRLELYVYEKNWKDSDEFT